MHMPVYSVENFRKELLKDLEHISPFRLIIMNVIQYRLFASFHDELTYKIVWIVKSVSVHKKLITVYGQVKY